MNDTKKKRFLWGLLLAWLPWIPVGISLIHSLRGISEQKATGLGAIAGGFAETFLMFGLGITLLCEMGAIVMLACTFSRGHAARALVSVGAICSSLLMLALFGLFLWFYLSHVPRAV